MLSMAGTAVGATAFAVVYAFNSFARIDHLHADMISQAQFNDFAVERYIDKYYESEYVYETDADEADKKRALATMRRLKLKICKIEPTWDECDGTA